MAIKKNVLDKIEQLLTTGFLTLPIDICGISFIFKTLSPAEYFLIKQKSLYRGKFNNFKFFTYYIIHSIFLIDSINFLPYIEVCELDLLKIFNSWTKAFSLELYNILNDLNKQVVELQKNIKEYVKTDESKYYWDFYKRSNISLNDLSHTGVQGTEKLGLNYIQKSWIALNSFEDKIRQVEDKQQELDVIWQYAKFVGKCFNPKFIQNVEAQEKHLKAVRENENKGTGFITNNPDFARGQNTAEELIKELEAMTKGEKDKHDQLIEALYKRQKWIEEEEQKELKEKRKQLNMDLTAGIDGETTIIDYSKINRKK